MDLVHHPSRYLVLLVRVGDEAPTHVVRQGAGQPQVLSAQGLDGNADPCCRLGEGGGVGFWDAGKALTNLVGRKGGRG